MIKLLKKPGILLLTALLYLLPAASVHAKPCASAKGFPVWGVNNINLNLYITDIPLWYTPQVGPEVAIKLSYNSQADVVPGAPFGNKWQFNYQSALSIGSNSITVTMPDGRVDVYSGSGTYTAPVGVFSTLSNVGGNRYELKHTSGKTYVYDIPGETTLAGPVLVQIKDAYGNALSFGYNNANQLATITDAQSRVTVVEYTNGHVTRATDPFGRSATFDYTGNELTRITDMGGYVAEMSYQVNPRDNKVYIATLTNKGLGGTLQPAETTTFYIEPDDGTGIPSGSYPSPGGPMLSSYRVTITSPPVERYPNGAKEEYYYLGAYTWYVSPRDYVEYVDANTNNYKLAPKTYYYLDRTDPKGRVNKVKRPEGGYVAYSNFDPVTGQAQTVTDYHGLDSSNNPVTHSVAYTFNSKGNVVSITPAKAGSAVTTLTYYPNNIDLQSIYNGLGTVSFTYNGDTHDVKTITDRLGVITEYGYDNTTGKLTSVTRAKGTAVQSVTEMVYDSGTKDLTGIKQNDEVVSSFTYGNPASTPPGRVETATDASGVTLGYRYDNLDRVTAVTYPDTVYSGGDPTAKYQRIDYSGCCTQMVGSTTDRAGRTTTYTHDALKRITQVNSPEGVFRFSYDGNGNLTKRIDANNNETRFEYNLDNRRTKKIFADGKYVLTAYDKAGLPKTFTNSRNIVKSYTFDANHNLTNIGYSDATPNIVNTYDAYDRLTQRTDGTGLTTYTYYADNRLHTVDGPWDNDLITYTYNELGDLKSVTPVTGQAITYTYDYESTDPGVKKVGRLVNIVKSGDTFTYGYAGASPLIQSLTRPNGSVTEYQYDNPLKRLTALINKKSTAEIINSYLYEYNDVDPDLKSKETITNGEPITSITSGTTDYTPNILNQTTAATNPNRTYLFDDDGNMTQAYTPEGYVLTMVYDAENRMKSAEFTDSGSVQRKTEYVWSGDNLLAEMKKYQNGALTQDTRYIRAGFLPIQERDAANAITREYTWGLNLGGGIGGLLNLRYGGNDYAYLYDGKGNVSALVDGTQAVAAAYAYDPFGVLVRKAGTLDQRYQFSTKEYAPETGLTYYGYRFYAPSIAKWTTRDPLEEAGGVNLYGFVGNNPVNTIDPFGLQGTPRRNQCEEEARKVYEACIQQMDKIQQGKNLNCIQDSIITGTLVGVLTDSATFGTIVGGTLVCGCFAIDWLDTAFSTGKIGCAQQRQRVYDLCMYDAEFNK